MVPLAFLELQIGFLVEGSFLVIDLLGESGLERRTYHKDNTEREKGNLYHGCDSLDTVSSEFRMAC